MTYHVIGCAPIDETREGLYPAMSRVEMEQQRQKALRDGYRITHWYAQTRTGERILGSREAIPDHKAPRARTVTCEPCGGAGCFVCDNSGICRPGHWLLWHEWQLHDTRAKRDAERAGAGEMLP